MRLIDADALKRKTQKVATEAWKLQIKATVETVMNQFIEFIDKAPTVSGWVSVKDRLPEETESMFARFHATEKWNRAMWKNESETVLVCVLFPDGGRKVTVGRLHDGKWNTSVSKVLTHEVTHWMPLPEPPKEEEHETN